MKKKHAGGRPSKYKEALCQALIEHMTKGYTYETFAAICDVHIDTLYEWEKKYPEFSEAKRIGWVKSQYHWETLALDSIHDPHTLAWTPWIFVMKCRFGWRDQSPVDIIAKDVHVIVTDEGEKEYPI